MPIPKIERKNIIITQLIVNPDNVRFIEAVENEKDAIINMFKQKLPSQEMYNLATDIAENALNPFEHPIVWFNPEIKKYLVIEGNRRITCIKLMTQYRNNKSILSATFDYVSDIYKLEYKHSKKIECVVYEKLEEALKVLPKIHEDVNSGIGRKQWGAHEKQKFQATLGNKSKTYSIIEALKNDPTINNVLKETMNSKKWVSKLERVVSFSNFKKYYAVDFNDNNEIIYKQDTKLIHKNLEKLVQDLIDKPATGNFRSKEDFDNYYSKLPDEYRCKDISKSEKTTTTTKKVLKKPKQNKNKRGPEVLLLSEKFDDADLNCLNEKGATMLNELQSLDVTSYPYASAALCRALLEYTLSLWFKKFKISFDNKNLLSNYIAVVNQLQIRNIIDNKTHAAMMTIKKTSFIERLNCWIHSDSKECVDISLLIDKWKICRLIIEYYLDKEKNEKN